MVQIVVPNAFCKRPVQGCPLGSPIPAGKIASNPVCLAHIAVFKQIRTPMSLEKIFADVFDIAEETVLDSLALTDIPTWDSMAHMMFIVRLEEDYLIQFTGDEIADIRTVGDTRAALLLHGVKL
jgi:acyl carrier protein